MMFFIPVGLELWLLWKLIVPIDLHWEKWKLTVSAVSLEIFDFFFGSKPVLESFSDIQCVFLEDSRRHCIFL